MKKNDVGSWSPTLFAGKKAKGWGTEVLFLVSISANGRPSAHWGSGG
jgi:hypothetical protein